MINVKYEGFAIKSRGSSHIDKGMPCQDAVQYHQDLQTVTVCTADGHGSSQYFRSERGSDFAANIACRKMELFLHYSDLLSADEAQQEKKITNLIRSIITEWQLAVRNDILNDPFTNDEMLFVPERDAQIYTMLSKAKVSEYSEYQRNEILNAENTSVNVSKVYKSYGSTLICVGLCDDYAIGLHIGDGKCVALYDDGTTDEPIPWDENCHLNLCTSICDLKAESEFRFYVWKKRIPIAIFCGSDGIDDTFADRLHSFYMNIAIDLAKPYFRDQIKRLESQLPEISKRGSKDDVSIAGIIHIDKIRQAEPLLQKQMHLAQNAVIIESEKQRLTELQFKFERTQRILKACTEEAEEKISQYREKLMLIEKEMNDVQRHIDDLTQTDDWTEQTADTRSEDGKENKATISEETLQITEREEQI